MKKAIDFFTAHPARFFLLAALLWGGFMSFFNYLESKKGEFKWHDLLVEANGMVFDLLVFGILLSIYERFREKRDKIERLHEEIDDYRGWDEKEATFRIVGAVRRLNKLGVTKINLSKCFLEKAKLERVFLYESFIMEANLVEANLLEASLHKAYLRAANLSKANLVGINLQGANLEGANLERANFKVAFLMEANLAAANLAGANLQGTFLIGANLWWANLQNAIVGNDWFDKIEKWEVGGIEQIKAKYLIDENGILREKQ